MKTCDEWSDLMAEMHAEETLFSGLCSTLHDGDDSVAESVNHGFGSIRAIPAWSAFFQ